MTLATCTHCGAEVLSVAAGCLRCELGAPANNHADPGRAFYVTVVDAGRVGFLAGPYELHTEALAAVEPAKTKGP